MLHALRSQVEEEQVARSGSSFLRGASWLTRGPDRVVSPLDRYRSGVDLGTEQDLPIIRGSPSHAQRASDMKYRSWPFEKPGIHCFSGMTWAASASLLHWQRPRSADGSTAPSPSRLERTKTEPPALKQASHDARHGPTSVGKRHPRHGVE